MLVICNGQVVTDAKRPTNNPLHTESRVARFDEINVVRRGPVSGDVACRKQRKERGIDRVGFRFRESTPVRSERRLSPEAILPAFLRA